MALCACAVSAAAQPASPPHAYPAVELVLSNFESAGEWSRGDLDAVTKVEGSTSLAWEPSGGTLSLNRSFDLLAYDGIRFWVHSNKAGGHEFLIYLSSENGDTVGGDYYDFKVQVNWTGWRLLEIPFPQFHANRTPLTYRSIDAIRFYGDGWGMTSDPEVVLHFDALVAYGYDYPERLTDPEVTVFDWRVGAVRGSSWSNLLEDNHPGQQFPSRIDVAWSPLYSFDAAVLRYRVHSGEDLSPFPDAENPTNKRAESHTVRGAYGAAPGDTVWWRFTYRWEKLDRTHQMTLFQWRSQRDGVTGGPGVELQFKPNGERLEIVGTGWAVPYEGRGVLVSDTVTDRWYDFICTVTYSVSDGAARCWVDGRLAWDYTGPTLESADHDNPHIRNGLYRWEAAGDFGDPVNGLTLDNGEMVAYQGLTAFAINVDDGYQKMLDAFPSSIHVDNFETGDDRCWSAFVP